MIKKVKTTIKKRTKTRLNIDIEDGQSGIQTSLKDEDFDTYEKNPDIPIKICFLSDSKSYYLCSNNVYLVNNEYFEDMDDLKHLILAHDIKMKKKLDRAKTIVTTQNLENQRTHIPDDVKEFVWRRDGGKCVKCGSQHHLEYDHIIPLNKGGSNTARNLQILCESCNREKSNYIS